MLLWTFRRNEKDVVNLYNALSPVMTLATGGRMLNFGYWTENTTTPLEAQEKLCDIAGEMAELASARTVIDVGSGLGAPAAYWKSRYALDVSCVNINLEQLRQSNGMPCANATSAALPFASESADRVIALESAQHFRPLARFCREAARVLQRGGILTVAIPVVNRPSLSKLGILSMTWSSEHYRASFVESAIKDAGLDVVETKMIGQSVYAPLADYYIQNRPRLRSLIMREYPGYLESILCRSMNKMKDVSQKGIIDYALVKAVKARAG
ncbi:class I SAM-dependent methyltransferase [Candidatus Nitrososphaera sp. FF02]|uniref:class I SAM-dependent methyltransferase n=1 Tax=Candidatus Nitrososphaera sp. FF02 TaxID=3398226 RepID=UPI0039ECF9C7